MSYEFIVEFAVMKGLGPDWIEKNVPIAYDDIEDDVPEYEVKRWAINDAEKYLKEHGFTRFSYREIHEA